MPALKTKPKKTMGQKYTPHGHGVSASVIGGNWERNAAENLSDWRREIQETRVRKAIAVDDTWRITTKSGHGKKGTLTTVTNEIGECVTAAFNRPTKQALVELVSARAARLRGLQVVFVDNMPTDESLYSAVLKLADDHIIQDSRHLHNRIPSCVRGDPRDVPRRRRRYR